MKKILLGVFAVLIVAVLAFVLYIQNAWKNRVFDAPYPDIKASTDSSIFVWGRYLDYGSAHCSFCLVPM